MNLPYHEADYISPEFRTGDSAVVAISKTLGESLYRWGREVFIDNEVLGEIMDFVEIPEEERGKINIFIEPTTKLGRRGQAWVNLDARSYGVAVCPTITQQYGFAASRMSQTVVHELQHVSDYIKRGYLDDPDKLSRDRRVQRMKRIIGPSAVTAASVLTFLPAQELTINALNHAPGLPSELGIAAVVGQFMGFTTSYPLSKHILYRMSSLEVEARRVAKESKHQFEHPITIRKSPIFS
jgi:hypothetical protein